MPSDDEVEIDLSEADPNYVPSPEERAEWHEMIEGEIVADEAPITLPAVTTSWGELDALAYLRGDLDEPPPALLARSDGPRLLYGGKVSSIAGEPESGKGWFAMAAVREAMQEHGHVVYIDFEDGPKAVFGRLRHLGIRSEVIAKHFHYIRPTEKFDKGDTRREFASTLIRYRNTPEGLKLIVFDGITEALATQEIEPNDNAEVSKWFGDIPRFYAHQTGAAVLLIDHVVKANDSRGRYAVGAGAKLAAVDGSQFTVDIKKPFARNRSGLARISVTKDRPGHVREIAVGNGHTQAVADMVIDAGEKDGDLRIKLVQPDIQISEDGKVTPTGVEGEIVKYLRKVKGQQRPREHILSQVTGRNEVKRTAFNHMVDAGWLVEVRVGRKVEFRLGTPKDELAQRSDLDVEDQ